MADIFPLSGTATVSTSTCSSINNRATSTTTASNCAGANTNKTVTAHGSAAAKALEMSPPSSAGQLAQNLQALKFKCPRCDSLNTKFCYYNNYSLSQPRHFCKACKRYWTRGGTLRNVPVGGGCRKNKRVYHSPPLPPVSSNKMPCSSSLASCRNPSSTKEAPLTMIPSPLPTLPIADAVRAPPSSPAFIDRHAQHEARLSQLPQPLPSTTDHCSLQQRRPIKKIQQYSDQSPVELRLQEFGNFGMINDVIFNSSTMGLESTSTSDWQKFNHINESGDQYSSYDLLLKRAIACWPDAAGQWSSSAHLI